MEIRLQKALAAAGVGSRRHCEALIASGRVSVDGNVVTELGTKADPGRAVIAVDGKPISRPQDKIYILLNKPVGYTSTRSDPHAKRTVIELLSDANLGADVVPYLFPVGRLDVDTSGLMVLTNDGELAQLLTHPSHEVEKTYVAVVRGSITSRTLSTLERGIELEDGVTAPAKARLISWSPTNNTSKVEITIHEGRKRQVRRMFEAVDHKLISLSRTRLADLDIIGLKEGHYRHLTKKEVARLKRSTQRGENQP